jgi:hypothetical protein
MVIISPHGFSISPNLPNPECSTELNVTTASHFSSFYNNIYLGRTKSIPVWTVKDVDKMIVSKAGKAGRNIQSK